MGKEDGVYIYTMEYYSAMKKNHAAICDNVDETWGHYTKWDEADKDKYKYYILLICGNQN